jgi:hypothetical protein
MLIDDAKDFSPVKLSISYVKGNFFPVLFSCFIGFGVPILLGSWIHGMLGGIGITVENFRLWLNPESRQYGLIFLYHLTLYGFQGLVYPILPSLSFLLYFKIKNKKLKEMIASKGKGKLENDAVEEEKILNVYVRGGQKKVRCPSCGNSLTVGMKKCIQCGKLLKYKFN